MTSSISVQARGRAGDEGMEEVRGGAEGRGGEAREQVDGKRVSKDYRETPKEVKKCVGGGK